MHFFNLTDFNIEIPHIEKVWLSLENKFKNESVKNNYGKISLNIFLTNLGFQMLILNNQNQIYETKNWFKVFSPTLILRGLIHPIGTIHKYHWTL